MIFKRKLTNKDVFLVGLFAVLWIFFIYSFKDTEILENSIIGFDVLEVWFYPGGETGEPGGGVVIIGEEPGVPGGGGGGGGFSGGQSSPDSFTPEINEGSTVNVNLQEYILNQEQVNVLLVESKTFVDIVKLDPDEKTIINSAVGGVQELSSHIKSDLPEPLPSFAPIYIENVLEEEVKVKFEKTSDDVQYSPSEDKKSLILKGTVEKTGEEFNVITSIENGRPSINFQFND